MKLDYVDLYLIHQSRNCEGDIAGTWKKMEELMDMGLARNIGISKCVATFFKYATS